MERKLFNIEIDDYQMYYAYAYDENECIKLLYDLGAFVNGVKSMLVDEVTPQILKNILLIDEDSGFNSNVYEFIEIESSMFSKAIAIEYC